MNVQGTGNVRFHAYRLVNSRCYDSDDARIGCVACHDPQQSPNHDASFYDAKCLACHSSNGGAAAGRAANAPACSVGSAKCSGCHMPKVELPGGHFAFTDHQIRIVRAGDPYPN